MKFVLPAIMALVAILGAVMWILDDSPRTVIYDCRLAEISPDFPLAIREECRRRIYEFWKEEQEKKTIRTYI